MTHSYRALGGGGGGDDDDGNTKDNDANNNNDGDNGHTKDHDVNDNDDDDTVDVMMFIAMIMRTTQMTMLLTRRQVVQVLAGVAGRQVVHTAVQLSAGDDTQLQCL